MSICFFYAQLSFSRNSRRAASIPFSAGRAFVLHGYVVYDTGHIYVSRVLYHIRILAVVLGNLITPSCSCGRINLKLLPRNFSVRKRISILILYMNHDSLTGILHDRLGFIRDLIRNRAACKRYLAVPVHVQLPCNGLCLAILRRCYITRIFCQATVRYFVCKVMRYFFFICIFTLYFDCIRCFFGSNHGTIHFAVIYFCRILDRYLLAMSNRRNRRIKSISSVCTIPRHIVWICYFGILVISKHITGKSIMNLYIFICSDGSDIYRVPDSILIPVKPRCLVDIQIMLSVNRNYLCYVVTKL